MRVIRNPYVDDWERRTEEIQPFPLQAVTSMQEGVFKVLVPESSGEIDPERDCMPCGQGAGSIGDIPTCAEIIERVMEEARETIQALTKLA
jgi:enoyl-[acyl-carrier protein] reductase II